MEGITENNSEILKTISDNITGWSFERIGNVEKALLKCSVYEILFEDTPREIVINEVVELAKVYGDEKYLDYLMAHNFLLLDYFVFPAGVTVNTPSLSAQTQRDDLPSWRKGVQT